MNMMSCCQLLNLLVCLYCFLSTQLLWVHAEASASSPSHNNETMWSVKINAKATQSNKELFFYGGGRASSEPLLRTSSSSSSSSSSTANSIYSLAPVYQLYQVFSSQPRSPTTSTATSLIDLNVNEYAKSPQQRTRAGGDQVDNEDIDNDDDDDDDQTNNLAPSIYKRSVPVVAAGATTLNDDDNDDTNGDGGAKTGSRSKKRDTAAGDNSYRQPANDERSIDNPSDGNSWELYNLTGLLTADGNSSNSSTNGTADMADMVDPVLDLIKKIVMTIIFIPTIVLTLIGNMLVIFAIVIVRKLHTQDNASNFLIVSLAVSDCLVGVLVMPLALYVELSPENKWQIAAWMCDLWTMSDVLLCTASILNLCAISIDRYFIILHAMVYTQRRNAKLMLLMILCVWLLSATISIPPLFGWGKPSASLKLKEQQCAVSEDIKYQIYASFFSFYLPLTTMIIIYLNIYRTARKIKKREMDTAGRLKVTMGTMQAMPMPYSLPDLSMNNIKSQTELLLDDNNNNININVNTINSNSTQIAAEHGVGTTSASTHTKTTTAKKSSSSKKSAKISLKNAVSENGSLESKAISISSGDTANSEMKPPHRLSVNLQSSILLNSPNHQQGGGGAHQHGVQNGGHVTMTTPSSIGGGSRRGSFGRRVGRRLTNVFKRTSNASSTHGKNQKATRTLGIIMGCFTLCWLPFFILAILKPITVNSKGDKLKDILPRWFDSLLLWLGYFNSALNPLIYARTNREFRRPFVEILCCRCRGINDKLRDEERRKMYNDELNSTTRRLSGMAGYNMVQVGSSRNSMSQQAKRMNNPSLNELSEEAASFEAAAAARRRQQVATTNSNSLNHVDSIYQSVSSEPGNGVAVRTRPLSTGAAPVSADYDDNSGERRISSEEISKQLRSLKYKFFDVKCDDDDDDENEQDGGGDNVPANNNNNNSSSTKNANEKTATGGFNDYCLELTKLVKLSEIDYFKSSDPDYSFSTIISKPESPAQRSVTAGGGGGGGVGVHVNERALEYFVLKKNVDSQQQQQQQDEVVELSCEIKDKVMRFGYTSADEHRLSNDDTIREVNEQSSNPDNAEDEQRSQLYGGEEEEEDDDVEMTCSDSDNQSAFNNQNSKKFMSFESARSFFESSPFIPPSKSMPNYADYNNNRSMPADSKRTTNVTAEKGSYDDEDDELNENSKLLTYNTTTRSAAAAQQQQQQQDPPHDAAKAAASSSFQFSLNSIPNSSVYSFTTALTSPTSIRTNSSLQSPADEEAGGQQAPLEQKSSRSSSDSDPNAAKDASTRQKKKLLNYTATKHQSIDHHVTMTTNNKPRSSNLMITTSTTTGSFLNQQQNAATATTIAFRAPPPPTSTSYNAHLASLAAQPGVLKPKKTNKASNSCKLLLSKSHDLPEEQILDEQDQQQSYNNSSSFVSESGDPRGDEQHHHRHQSPQGGHKAQEN